MDKVERGSSFSLHKWYKTSSYFMSSLSSVRRFVVDLGSLRLVTTSSLPIWATRLHRTVRRPGLAWTSGNVLCSVQDHFIH